MKPRPRLLLAFVALAGVATTFGCGGDDTTEPPAPPTPMAVTVSPATPALTALGSTVQLSAEVRDQNGQTIAGATVTWTSGSPLIATVNASGLVTAVDNGSATITATARTASGSASVTVAQEVSEAEVLPAAGTVSVGDTLRLSADASDANGHAVQDASFGWETSDAAVATVDDSGLVRGVAVGSATITASSAEAQAEARITVDNPDLAALAAFYEATNGLGWIENDGWLSDRPVGEWHGVTTGESGRVTGLHLSASDLSGHLPVELVDLSHLETLELERNSLTGPIPPELGSLRRLRTVVLGVNGLTGPIPAELGRLENLRVLRLRRNQLSGSVPAELGGLRHLERLGVDRNDLSGSIPVAFLGLAGLRVLHFAANAGLCVPRTQEFETWLDGLELYVGPPCDAGDRATLASLHNAMGGTDWTRSDGWLGDGPLGEWYGVGADSLGRVATLDLSDNGLVGRIPALLAELAGITSLRLDGNAGLTGPLSLSLTALPLREFRYAGTGLCVPEDQSLAAWLAGIPSHDGTDTPCSPVSDRAVLEALYHASGGSEWIVADNWLSDRPLGEWHGVTTDDDGRVVGLALPRNSLAGRLPPELGHLDSLRELDLPDNRLRGPIPPELGNLTALETLRLTFNRFSGSMPPELGNLSNLSVLHLPWNGLSGSIPAEFGRLSRLVELDLGWNGLGGEIPPELGNLAGLEILAVRSNDLTGAIPAELGQLSALRNLDLGYNRLTGGLPPELGSLPSMHHLNLTGNQLTGPIPSEWGNLSSLFTLMLRENRLTGPIPPELGALPYLNELDLSSNRLTGSVPPEIGKIDHLFEAYLENNLLSGSLPPTLGDLTYLETLFVGGNQLSGALPPELGRLAGLKRLQLSNNPDLSGALPSDLTALANLQELLMSGTGLCAPDDAGFQDWLSRVTLARVGTCGLGAGSTAYLTQAVQSLAHPIPLVANRDALLRVFAKASQATSAGMPKVRATFHLAGAETLSVEIPGSEVPIPTAIAEAEAALAKSANVRIPGSVIRPGVEMVVEIDPGGALDPSLGVTKRIPETGRLQLRVETIPTLDLTFVPFLWTQNPDSSIVDLANGMAADPQAHETLGDVRAMLPVDDLDVKAHEPVLTSTNDVLELTIQTNLIRQMEEGDGYWMGIMSEYVVGGQSGLAAVGGRFGFSAADPFVIAHELGHNFGLYHAPCGNAPGVDRTFPQANASIGGWGYDFREAGALVPPHARDLMSYCGPPRWISDYHFAKALNHRLATGRTATTAADMVADATTRSLLIWGGVDSGDNPFLRPAFVTDARPTAPASAGEYLLVGRGSSGNQLFSLNLDMTEVADGDGTSTFLVSLPMRPEWDGELGSITLSGPGGSTTMDLETDQPMAILRDAATGRVRGILSGEDATALLEAAAQAGDPATTRRELVFSRGIPTETTRRR